MSSMAGSALFVLLLWFLCVSSGASTGRTYGVAVQASDQLQASFTSTMASVQHRQVCAWVMHAYLHAGTPPDRRDLSSAACAPWMLLAVSERPDASPVLLVLQQLTTRHCSRDCVSTTTCNSSSNSRVPSNGCCPHASPKHAITAMILSDIAHSCVHAASGGFCRRHPVR